ncbi:hypothetical protein AB0F42_33155 [Streptomyces buecherae]|uniref:hypothetical protein n=1 Tax=Streptomyces buecherae TaxID=2763006 RepID=UPI00340A578D
MAQRVAGRDFGPLDNAGQAALVRTAELPQGGRGASGQGTDLSVLALHEYQRPKTVTARLALGPTRA